MIGATELAIIAVVAALFFFGKDKVIDWAKSFGEAKKAFGEASQPTKVVDVK